ncbi:MAG: hypothetical protein CMQ57_01220 [Gammaproteobacteria bacterium]|nr:hypothetical protein [Gammaproteobacteria bacterium]|tara:strand:- start:1333 stop:2223 length:891 start_codon:yes stop_codon:yes gene_type:complete
MPSYNFKREAQLFIVDGSSRYSIDISDVSFSQTFAEESYTVKTLHAPTDYFEGSVINKANAANFSFTMPAIQEADFTIVENFLINNSSFTIFVSTPTDVFKLDTCVITNGSFVIEKSRPLSIEIQGEASKLTNQASLSGTLQSRSNTKNYLVNPKLAVTLDSSSLTDIVSVKIELQNEIDWTPYSTIHAARAVTSASNSMYPSGYVVSKKILAGSISQYLTDTNKSTAQSWDTSVALEIKAGNGQTGSSFRGFHVGPATSTFTNRMSAGDVFIQNYDWRVTDNSSSLSSIFKYVTN